MKVILRIGVALVLGGCTLTPDQQAWNRAHHVGEVCWTCKPGEISSSPGQADSSSFNGKNYADPNPHSASDDAQRAAYMQHQQEQQQPSAPPAEPDLSAMHCSGSSSVSTGGNAGSMVGSTSCHN